MGGLGVADVPNLSAEDSAQTAYDEMRRSSENSDEDDEYGHQGLVPVNDDELQNGWGGMGLRGNHSSGSLNRSNSGASGLFLMDDEDGHHLQQQTKDI